MSDQPFIIPKTDEVAVKVPRPLTNKEKKRLHKLAGGDANANQLASLERKFGRKFDDKVKSDGPPAVKPVNPMEVPIGALGSADWDKQKQDTSMRGPGGKTKNVSGKKGGK